MSDLFTPARTIVAVKFGFSDKTYDYLVPEGLEVEPGMKVFVATKRGEAKVEIFEIKTESDKASASILRIVEPEIQPEPEVD
ncbi:hypothetical protein [Mesorhizobium sp. M0859]|uniref:primosomal protein N' family DNA-binding protein n=1 Tax=Mesorhizobium sp. M0859 TaxID=2957014 RepID=UPI003338BC11